MKVIFLDIDGVICTLRSHIAAGDDGLMKKLDPVAIGLINQLLEIEQDTRLVISSTWRFGSTSEEIFQKFRDEGFKGKFHDDWCTPSSESRFRGDEVNAWLSRNPEVTKYVCIDDDSDFYPNQPLIKTNFYNGLSIKNFFQASKILFGHENAWLHHKRPGLIVAKPERHEL